MGLGPGWVKIKLVPGPGDSAAADSQEGQQVLAPPAPEGWRHSQALMGS